MTVIICTRSEQSFGVGAIAHMEWCCRVYCCLYCLLWIYLPSFTL